MKALNISNRKLKTCSTICNIRHSTRTSHAPRTTGLVDAQKKYLGTLLPMLSHDTSENRSIRVPFSAHGYNTQPISQLQIPPHETVSLT